MEKLTRKELEKYRKRYKRAYIITVLATIATFTIFALGIYFMWPLQADTEIIYDGLNENQTQIVKQMLSVTKEDYLAPNERVIFTNNISNYKSGVVGYNSLTVGINTGRQIVVEYRDYLPSMRKTFCHEMAHSFILGGWFPPEVDLSHRIVQDLGHQEVCFWDSQNNVDRLEVTLK